MQLQTLSYESPETRGIARHHRRDQLEWERSERRRAQRARGEWGLAHLPLCLSAASLALAVLSASVSLSEPREVGDEPADAFPRLAIVACVLAVITAIVSQSRFPDKRRHRRVHWVRRVRRIALRLGIASLALVCAGEIVAALVRQAMVGE